jgi:hypothetical protein
MTPVSRLATDMKLLKRVAVDVASRTTQLLKAAAKTLLRTAGVANLNPATLAAVEAQTKVVAAVSPNLRQRQALSGIKPSRLPSSLLRLVLASNPSGATDRFRNNAKRATMTKLSRSSTVH